MLHPQLKVLELERQKSWQIIFRVIKLVKTILCLLIAVALHLVSVSQKMHEHEFSQIM